MSGHLVSLIKHHGLFAPYIVANFTPNPTFLLTLLTRKSWLVYILSHVTESKGIFSSYMLLYPMVPSSYYIWYSEFHKGEPLLT
jgi:hypothetical protein